MALDFDPKLFDTTTAQQITGRLRMLLTAIADNPGRPLSQLPWMSAHERHHVLTQGTATDLEVPAATFPELFEAQAARTPDATALVCGDVRLSFAELNARANRLARYLVSRGAGPERVVAVALPRSAGMVAAMLAVAKAGGGYLPVEPGLPACPVQGFLAGARPVVVGTVPVARA